VLVFNGGMGVAKRSTAVILLLLATALFCVLLGLWMSGGNWKSVMTISPGPVVGAGIGLLLRYWWEGRKSKRKTLRCHLRLIRGLDPQPSPKWTYGAATPSEGRLVFQPRAAFFGPDVGDVVQIAVQRHGHEREPRWSELFKFSPFSRILCLETGEGQVEVAASRADLCAAQELIGMPFSQHH
jgi:hypothetical protein